MTLRLTGAVFAVALVGLLWGVPGGRAAEAGPRLDARAWMLIDGRTGEALASHAAARRLPIASTTKLMTAYLVLRDLPLSRIVRASRYRPTYGESLLGLRRGERISVRDLLYGLILRSGNDAAYDLARADAGSERGFVREMNRTAAALGLADTHYANPIGLDQRGNRSSARDLAALARRLLRIPAFARIADARTAELNSVRPHRRIATVNALLWMAPWATGVKTGHTVKARFVLVGSGRREGVELIAVVLGAATDTARFGGALRLLDYGFSRYRGRMPIHAGQALAHPSIRYSGGSLPLRAAHTVPIGVRAGETLSTVVRAPEEVQGPISRGEVLGQAVVRVDGTRARAVALRAGRSVPRASTLDRWRSALEGNPALLLLVLFVILIGTVLGRRLRRRPSRHESEP